MPFRKYTQAKGAVQAQTMLPETAQDLARELTQMVDAVARARLLSALVAMETPEAVAALVGLLDDADPAVRAAGVEGLRRLPEGLRCPALVGLLDHVSPDVRIRALDAVERVPDAQVEGWLIALLSREMDSNVCGVVLDLLAEMGTVAALPAIRAARLRFANEPFIAFAADLALAQIAEG